MIFLLSLLAAAPASAAQGYCPPPREVRAHVDYCFQNSFFVDAADRCLEKFDRDVLAHRDRLGLELARNDGGSAAAQSSKLRNSGADLDDADRSLGSLLLSGKAARADLVTYTGSLIYVNDASPAFLQYYGLTAEHQADPCFRENREKLVERIAKLDARITDLQRADNSARALAAAAGSRQKKLGGGAELAPAVSRTRGQGSAGGVPVRGGAARNPSSTITGEIKPAELR